MNKKMELLAPAGDWDSFLAAVENGADAVYLGGRLFNARQSAANFDGEQLKKALDYAHIRDAKIYLALNTLLTDREVPQALEFACEAYDMGIDGVIVQDIGLAGQLHRNFPGLDLHGSTQMTVYNTEGVRLLETLGFKRVVLARELSLEEIERICRETSIEVEVFVHGALCISYSGQCLMSSMIGGRSGNRGKCAQPCRLPYAMNKREDRSHWDKQEKKIQRAAYLLSPKDLCGLDLLDGFKEAGVASLKIEGRMKSPEYVAIVTSTYRKYLDHIQKEGCKPAKGLAVEAEDKRKLMQVFNRGGFSQGYLKGKCGSDLMCYEKPKNWGLYLGEVISSDRGRRSVEIKLHGNLALGDGIEIWNGEEESPGTVVSEMKVKGSTVVSAAAGQIVTIGNVAGNIFKGNKVYKTSDKSLNISARESYSSRPLKKIPISAEIILRMGQAAVLTVTDLRGNKATVSVEALPEPALNKALTEERLREQLNKTGDTPYFFDSIQIRLDENVSFPVGEINSLRRRALEGLSGKRRGIKIQKSNLVACEQLRSMSYFPGNSRKKSEELKVSVFFWNVDASFQFSQLNAERIYLPIEWLEKNGWSLLTELKKKFEVFLWISPITRGNTEKGLHDHLERAASWGADGVLVGNTGTLKFIEKMKMAGDYSLNVFNSHSLEEMKRLGLSSVVLSPELSLKQMEALQEIPDIEKEVLVFGRLPLMTSEYCAVGSVFGGCKAGSPCKGSCRNAQYFLKDRKGMEFPVFCDPLDCRMTILNANRLLILEDISALKESGVDWIRLMITDEEPDEILDIARMYSDLAERGPQVLKQYEALVENIRSKGFTKGHLHRGV